MIKVGITGGIGSGKSTVCRLFAACGAPVYDSDTQAKRLMEEDGPLRRRLAAVWFKKLIARYDVVTMLRWVYCLAALMVLPFGAH